MPRRTRIDAPAVVHNVIVRGIERRPFSWGDEDRLEREGCDLGEVTVRMTRKTLTIQRGIHRVEPVWSGTMGIDYFHPFLMLTARARAPA
jgi:hypothetical protein